MFSFLDKPFPVGDLHLDANGRSKPITVVESFDVGDTVQDGDWVTRWGWLMEWGEGCMKPPQLEELRHEGDPVSDAVVRFLGLKAGDDGLKRLDDYIANTPRDDWNPSITAFWDAVARDPPGGVTALSFPDSDSNMSKENIPYGHDPKDGHLGAGFEGYERNCEAAMLRRNRSPPPVLSEGQAVFWRYSVDMFATLLHFSLAGGFASPRIMATLRETGYLTSPSRDATYRRLMETTLALVDFMTDMTPITGKGWKSAVRVRMLHSQVRIRILDRQSRLKTYSVEKDGIPINQEDLAATLGGFCMAPLWCQRRLGIYLTVQEELAFIAAWRHVGYYLGISPALLTKYFRTDDPTTSTRSHRFFACLAFHLFTPEVPKDPFSTPTYTILHAVAHRPPNDKTTSYHCELSRFLLGPGLSDQLAIPRGTWKEWLGIRQHVWTSWVVARFSKIYRPDWEIRRQALFRRVIYLIVCWQLGERRSRFTLKEEVDHAKKVSELDSDEAGEPAGVDFGMDVGLEVKSQAKWLFAEMGGVVAGLGLVSTFAVWQTVKLGLSWWNQSYL